jgi:hypothetical protein
MSVDNLELLLEKLNLLDETQRRGCTEEDILKLEKKYGFRLPYSYKSFLLAFGFGGSGVFDLNEIDYTYDKVLEMTEYMINQRNQIIEKEKESGIVDVSEPFPQNICFIANRYGEQLNYIIADGGEDSEVYYFDFEDDVFEKKYDSIWEWLEVNAKERKSMLDTIQ